MSIKNLYNDEAIKYLKHEKAKDILVDFAMHIQTSDLWFNVLLKKVGINFEGINADLYPKLEQYETKFGVKKKISSIIIRAAITGTTTGFDLWKTVEIMGMNAALNNITYSLVTYCGLVDTTAYWEDIYLRN